MDRGRILQQVIQPFRAQLPGSFQRFDWSTRELGEPEPLPDAEVLIIDGIGLFHPELERTFDLSIWVGVSLETAAQRGRDRDRTLGRQNDALWDGVWVPNDREFDERFRPTDLADLVYQPRSR
jgi:uridine kinase